MPIYEYYCPDCKLKFEQLRPISRAGEKAPCPRCQEEAGRALSAFACFSTDESGSTSPIGSPCTGCNATTCDSCDL